jgi:hypothetical protein
VITNVLALVITEIHKVDIAFMTFDMYRFVGDTYDDDNGDDGEDDDNRIDCNDIDDNVDTLDDDDDEEEEEEEADEESEEGEEEEEEEEEGTKNDENTQHKKRISTPDSREWVTCPNCMGCGFVGNICSKCNEDGEALVSMVFGKVMMSTPETSAKCPARDGYGK